MTKTVVLAALLALLTAGCYTKMYRPEGAPMEERGPYDQIYSRYDSTAIDTTLTKPEIADVYPQEDNYGWNYWGRPRGSTWGRPRTRWGFDFYNYSPGYYWSYYGYYDYYSVPWWNRYYDPWYNGGWAPPAAPGEPPSQRDYGRRERPSGSGGPYAPPPGGGGYTQPQSAPPSPPPQQKRPDDSRKQQDQPKQEDQNRRGGRRGR